MELAFNESQEMLRRTAREFLEANCPTTLVRELESTAKGYSPALWEQMAGLGWLGLALPVEHGGEGETPSISWCCRRRWDGRCYHRHI